MRLRSASTAASLAESVSRASSIATVAPFANAINTFEGRKFDYTPRNRFEEEYSRFPTQEIERIRNDVVMDALSAVSIRMGAMRQGRKSIIFVSEGFTVMLPPQLQRGNAQDPIDPAVAAAGTALSAMVVP